LRIGRVAVVILLAILITAISCGLLSGKEAFTSEDVWVCNYIRGYEYAVCVELRPTNSASPDKVYVIELYQDERLRDSTTLKWRPPFRDIPPRVEIVCFPLTQSEFEVYYPKMFVGDIFSVKVCELE